MAHFLTKTKAISGCASQMGRYHFLSHISRHRSHNISFERESLIKVFGLLSFLHG